jgi:hypothetical protein
VRIQEERKARGRTGEAVGSLVGNGGSKNCGEILKGLRLGTGIVDGESRGKKQPLL